MFKLNMDKIMWNSCLCLIMACETWTYVPKVLFLGIFLFYKGKWKVIAFSLCHVISAESTNIPCWHTQLSYV